MRRTSPQCDLKPIIDEGALAYSGGVCEAEKIYEALGILQ